MKKWIFRALASALALTLLVSGGMLIRRALEDRASLEDYDSAESFAFAQSAPPARTPEPSAASSPPPTEPPDPQALALLETDLEALRAVNPEVIGWICIPGTDLNYPLMFSGDNAYYLNHTWKGAPNAGGAIFLEQACAPDLSDFNVIIYGHRMGNTTMFGSLAFYESEEFWREHPSVYLVDDGGVWRCDVFAAYTVGVREKTYRLSITEEEDKQAYIDFCVDRASYPTGVSPTTEGQVLTLSTCTGLGASPDRWVVQAVFAARTQRTR